MEGAASCRDGSVSDWCVCKSSSWVWSCITSVLQAGWPNLKSNVTRTCNRRSYSDRWSATARDTTAKLAAKRFVCWSQKESRCPEKLTSGNVSHCEGRSTLSSTSSLIDPKKAARALLVDTILDRSLDMLAPPRDRRVDRRVELREAHTAREAGRAASYIAACDDRPRMVVDPPAGWRGRVGVVWRGP